MTLAGEAASGDGVRRKGRGFQTPRDGIRSDAQFDKAESDERSTGRAQRSIEGWIIVITGVHEEATEEELSERFADYGVVQNLHLNLDRRTGYVKGYALVEYETYKEAKAAIDAEDGQEMLGETIRCDFAFVRPAQNERDNRGRR
ncbi:hypothetical protein THASP1DRAFT_15146 [Thamnocephalis sphaerospora]|uniref:RRM domain-containing protein n=1 Tax=Thamnocephalis sphaerospora TaxID=78915 RepID=A0A4P9XRT3_9FUNG|nr:hypothetical protein THASP1DRAFT_15146 [Thamnocephalis sphaerospora]|eukprot:RKP08805.1 hypothetical protein THASP1DRAFT_15146 [Thamnocephalis sphaerospora]